MSDQYIDDEIIIPVDHSEYITYKSFYSVEELDEFMLFFKGTNVLHYIEKVVLDIEKNIVGSPLQPVSVLKIHPEDFIKTNELYQQYLEENGTLLKDHILFQFESEELIKIVSNSNTDWSIDNQIIAKAILNLRKIPITTPEESSVPESAVSILVLFIILVFGLIPIIYFHVASLAILVSIFKMTKTYSNGKILFSYDAKSRSTAKLFFYILLSYMLLFYFYLFIK